MACNLATLTSKLANDIPALCDTETPSTFSNQEAIDTLNIDLDNILYALPCLISCGVCINYSPVTDLIKQIKEKFKEISEAIGNNQDS
jgi:hypothetical protein